MEKKPPIKPPVKKKPPIKPPVKKKLPPVKPPVKKKLPPVKPPVKKGGVTIVYERPETKENGNYDKHIKLLIKQKKLENDFTCDKIRFGWK